MTHGHCLAHGYHGHGNRMADIIARYRIYVVVSHCCWYVLVNRNGLLSCCRRLHRCCSQCCTAVRRATGRSVSPLLRAALGCFSQAGHLSARVSLRRPERKSEDCLICLCCRRPPHSPKPKPRSSQDARSSQEGDRDGRQGVGAGKSQSLVTYRCIFVMEFCDTGMCAAADRSTSCMVSIASQTWGLPPGLKCKGIAVTSA